MELRKRGGMIFITKSFVFRICLFLSIVTEFLKPFLKGLACLSRALAFRHPSREIGARAANMLKSLIEGLQASCGLLPELLHAFLKRLKLSTIILDSP